MEKIDISLGIMDAREMDRRDIFYDNFLISVPKHTVWVLI